MDTYCINKIKINVIIGVILLFLILCFPRSLQMVKVAFCLMIVVFEIIGERKLSKSLLVFYLLWSVYVLFTLIVGIVFHNQQGGLADIVKVGIFNYGLYVFIISFLLYEVSLSTIIKTIYCSSVYIGVFNILLFGCSFLHISTAVFQKLDPTAMVGLHQGYSHIVATNMSTYMLIYPLILFFLGNETVTNLKYKWKLFAVVVSSVAMLLSGRRIIWGVLLFSVFMYMLFLIRDFKRFLQYTIVASFLLLIAFVFLTQKKIISIDGLIERMTMAFAGIDEFGSENVRNVQGDYLIQGFLESPIVGNGAGAVIENFYRNYTKPWIFELSYHLVLFQSGIVGAFLYLLALLYVLYRVISIKSVNNWMFWTVLVSFICVIVANATNPYFSSSFDFHMYIFLPLLLSEYMGMDFPQKDIIIKNDMRKEISS